MRAQTLVLQMIAQGVEFVDEPIDLLESLCPQCRWRLATMCPRSRDLQVALDCEKWGLMRLWSNPVRHTILEQFRLAIVSGIRGTRRLKKRPSREA